MDPSDFELAYVAGIDLIQRAIARISVVAAVCRPFIARLGDWAIAVDPAPTNAKPKTPAAMACVKCFMVTLLLVLEISPLRASRFCETRFGDRFSP